MTTLIGAIIGNILQMDLLDTEYSGDRVTYKYVTTSLLGSKGLQELKAKIMSMLDFPLDIPIDVRIYPVKKGVVMKEFIVEIDVPIGKFKAEHLKNLKMKYRFTDRAEF